MTRRIVDVFVTALWLGCTAFGGPIAHIAQFYRVYVQRKQWIDEATYASWVALCAALPGPTSSQVGIAIGAYRAGWLGACAAWLGFTLPAAVMMAVCARMVQAHTAIDVPVLLVGCTLAALAVVVHALTAMVRAHVTVAMLPFVCAGAGAMWLSPWAFALLVLGMFGVGAVRSPIPHVALPRIAKGVSILLLPLVVLPLIAYEYASIAPFVSSIEAFYRTGVLVFGGGHVVLPMLQSSLTLTSEEWLYGYGVMQALPGPLFAYAAYVGTLLFGVYGAVVAVVVIFAPSFVLVGLCKPIMTSLLGTPSWKRVLARVSACAVGIVALIACTFAIDVIRRPSDALIVVVCALLLRCKGVPVWAVILCGALMAWLRVGMLPASW